MKNGEERRKLIIDLAVLAGLFIIALVVAICM